MAKRKRGTLKFVPPVPGINNPNLQSVGLDPVKGGTRQFSIMNAGEKSTGVGGGRKRKISKARILKAKSR